MLCDLVIVVHSHLMKERVLFLVDRTLPSLEENLALDEALLLHAEDGIGGEVLRFWEWRGPGVVLGASGQIAIDVEDAVCRAESVKVARRASGGGTVLVGAGCLLYSLVLNYERAAQLRDVNASYRWIMGRMQSILSAIHPDIEVAGISDLAIGDRKFSGNAQQRKRYHLLHHGTLLYGFDLEAVARYLKTPEKQPEYRRGRSHLDFICNLPTTAEKLKELLIAGWSAQGEFTLPIERMKGLLVEKYSFESWVRRR